MLLHGPGLLNNHGPLLSAERLPFIGYDSQRRLQRMGQITDLGARAFNNAAVIVDKRVHLHGKRRDFRRKCPIQPVSLALADKPQRFARAAQRIETHQDRECIDRNAAKAKQGEIKIKLARELADFGVNLAAIAHDAKARDLVGAVHFHFGFGDFQRFAVETGRVVSAAKIFVEGNDCRICCGN